MSYRIDPKIIEENPGSDYAEMFLAEIEEEYDKKLNIPVSDAKAALAAIRGAYGKVRGVIYQLEKKIADLHTRSYGTTGTEREKIQNQIRSLNGLLVHKLKEKKEILLEKRYWNGVVKMHNAGAIVTANKRDAK